MKTPANPRTAFTALMIVTTLLVGSLAFSACSASRFSMKLFCESPSGRVETNVSEAFFVRNLDVSDPLQREFLVPSDGSLCALAFSLPDTSLFETPKTSSPLSTRPSLQMRLYWPLPEKLKQGSVGKSQGAFVDIIDNYEATPAEKIYQLAQGGLKVDSLKKNKIYVSIDATFRSLAGDSLKFDGVARLKERKRLKFAQTSYQFNNSKQ